MFLSANIIHNIYAKNCAIIRHNYNKRVLNLLHVSAFLGHLQGGIQQRKIYKWLVSFFNPFLKMAEKCRKVGLPNIVDHFI